jgi:hypothetical protein
MDRPADHAGEDGACPALAHAVLVEAKPMVVGGPGSGWFMVRGGFPFRVAEQIAHGGVEHGE